MSEQETQTKEQDQQETPQSDVVEVEWQEIKEIAEARDRRIEIDNALASMLLEFEKRKQNLLLESLQIGDYMYQLGQQLRDQKNINTQFTYQLNLPKNPGEKGYFVRKES